MVAVSDGVEHSAITCTTNVWDKMPKSNVPKFFKSAWAYETHRRHPKNVGTLCADDRMRFERCVEFPANVATARLHRDPCKFTSTSRPLLIMPPSYLWPWD